MSLANLINTQPSYINELQFALTSNDPITIGSTISQVQAYLYRYRLPNSKIVHWVITPSTPTGWSQGPVNGYGTGTIPNNPNFPMAPNVYNYSAMFAGNTNKSQVAIRCLLLNGQISVGQDNGYGGLLPFSAQSTNNGWGSTLLSGVYLTP